MKKVSMVFVLGFLLLASCSKKSVMVDAAGNTGSNWKNYQTYGFASQVDNKLDEGFYFLNDLMLKSEVRESVKHELESRGYNYSNSQPDLIANFRVFDKPATIQSLDQYGPNYWASGEINGYTADQTVQLKPGSVVVHLVDRKTGKLVWQGYASGLMDGNLFNKQEDKIDEAVSLVFDQFTHRADNL